MADEKENHEIINNLGNYYQYIEKIMKNLKNII